MGPIINYVRNTGRWKDENCCFLMRLRNSTMLHCSLNNVSCLHYSVNSGGMCLLFSEQWRHASLFRPDQVQSNAQNALNWVQLSKIKKLYFLFLIVFYSLDDVLFAEFDHNSNLFLIIFYKLCCCVLKKPRKLSDVFQTWWNCR